MRRIALCIVVSLSFILMSCGNDSPKENKDASSTPAVKAHQLIKGQEVIIPKGFKILDVSEYGRVLATGITFYLQENSSGRIFQFKNGDFQREIIPPSGMILVGVCSYGELIEYPTFYCQDIATGQVFKCSN